MGDCAYLLVSDVQQKMTIQLYVNVQLNNQKKENMKNVHLFL